MKLFEKALLYIKNPKNLIWFFLFSFVSMLINGVLFLFSSILLLINVFFARISTIFLCFLLSWLLFGIMLYLESISVIQMDDLSVLSGMFIYVFGVSLICKSVYMFANRIGKNKDLSTSKKDTISFFILLLLNIFGLSIMCIPPNETVLCFILFCIYILISIPLTYALNKRKQLSFLKKVFSYNFWLIWFCGSITYCPWLEHDLNLAIFLGFFLFTIFAFFNIYFYLKAKTK